MVNKWLIINTLKHPYIITRTIDNLHIDTETICAGNSAVTARCYYGDSIDEMLIKCYLQRDEHSRFLYGSMYYDNELAIFSPNGVVEYIDVAFSRWIEGKALSECIADRRSDFKALSSRFDAFAYSLMYEPLVHCDIKPDNIIVRYDGEMMLVDNDALWSESFDHGQRREFGTAGFRDVHSTIYTPVEYSKNYPLVVISIVLAALSHNYDAMIKYLDDGALLEPSSRRGYNAALKVAREIFVAAADTKHLAILDAITPSGINVDGLSHKFYDAAYRRNGYDLGPFFDI